MLRTPVVPSALIAFAAGCTAFPPAVSAAPPPIGPVQITVDASDAARHVSKAHLVVPVHPGPLTLAYPKWIPGEHGPTGPLVNLAGPVITAGDKTIAWRRDPERLYEFQVDVPAGVSQLDIDLVYLDGTDTRGFSGGSSSTSQMLALSWNHVVLYPKGYAPEQLSYVAHLKLPAGWKFGTALPVAREQGATVDFAPASLVTLIDSPVLAGAHARVVPLGPDAGPKHEIDLAADTEEALEMKPDQLAGYRQLVVEARALFGAEHLRGYHFLYALSDHLGWYGLEHHESSDNRARERTLLDEDLWRVSAGLLPHEFVHSWNGKYRRPRGLATRDYQEPMRGELLWIYEGLTTYLGWVLTGRAGLLPEDEEREDLAATAAAMDRSPGRQWRPLEDTAIAAQVLYQAPDAWTSMRRSVDYYPEGLLIWLDVDVTIRKKTGGKASLDDFCRAFHGGKDGPPEVRPYDLEDVVRTLSSIVPGDWRAFFEERVRQATPHAPLGGVTGGGYKLSFTEEPNVVTESSLKVGKAAEARYSLGIVLGEDGAVADVAPGTPGAQAGLAPGMHLVAIDGHRYSTDALRGALARARKGKEPIELLVENGDYFRTLRADWHGGELHPHLERDAAQPDVIAEILRPRVPRAKGESKPPAAGKTGG